MNCSSKSSSSSSFSSVSSSKSSISSQSSSSSSISSSVSSSSSSRSSKPKPIHQGPDKPLNYIIPGGYVLVLDYPDPNEEYQGTPDYVEARKQCRDPNYVKREYTINEISILLAHYYRMDPDLFDHCTYVYIRALIFEIRFGGEGPKYIEWFSRILENKIRSLDFSHIDLPKYVTLRWLEPWWLESSKSSWSSSNSSSSSVSSNSS